MNNSRDVTGIEFRVTSYPFSRSGSRFIAEALDLLFVKYGKPPIASKRD